MRQTICALLAALIPYALCPGPAVSGPGQRLNVVVVAIDPLRADRLRAYGYVKDIAPSLNAFIDRAVVYESAISPASWTLPAAMSVFTSLYPHQHNVTNSRKPAAGAGIDIGALSTAAVTLPEIFKEQGYGTAAFTGGTPFHSVFGLARGFDVVDSGGYFRGVKNAFTAAAGWLNDRAEETPFFLFIHGFDMHDFNFALNKTNDDPSGPGGQGAYAEILRKMKLKDMGDINSQPYTRAERKLLNDSYDLRLKEGDRAFGDFLTFMRKKGLEENTIVVFLSHHGESLGWHGVYGHGKNLYEELVRVPLAISVPGRAPGRESGQVSLVDLAPTLILKAGLLPDKLFERQSRGRVLAPFSETRQPCRSVFSETSFLLRAEQSAVRTCAGWKLIHDLLNSRKELYDLKSDPGEKRDLFEREPVKAGELEEEMLEWTLDVE